MHFLHHGFNYLIRNLSFQFFTLIMNKAIIHAADVVSLEGGWRLSFKMTLCKSLIKVPEKKGNLFLVFFEH